MVARDGMAAEVAWWPDGMVARDGGQMAWWLEMAARWHGGQRWQPDGTVAGDGDFILCKKMPGLYTYSGMLP